MYIETNTWSKPEIASTNRPCPRRAHTLSYSRKDDSVYLFGGGDGDRALNDLWRLKLDDSTHPCRTARWERIQANDGAPPSPRGYHSANVVNDTLIIIGGSNGKDCYSDMYIFDLEKREWSGVTVSVGLRSPTANSTTPELPGKSKPSLVRMGHSATQVGNYLFVVGGHNGQRYLSDVLLLNLVTLEWELRKVYGLESPSGRGYHTAALHDSRLFIIGGYNGKDVFNQVWSIDLSGLAYLPRISVFSIGAGRKFLSDDDVSNLLSVSPSIGFDGVRHQLDTAPVEGEVVQRWPSGASIVHRSNPNLAASSLASRTVDDYDHSHSQQPDQSQNQQGSFLQRSGTRSRPNQRRSFISSVSLTSTALPLTSSSTGAAREKTSMSPIDGSTPESTSLHNSISLSQIAAAGGSGNLDPVSILQQQVSGQPPQQQPVPTPEAPPRTMKSSHSKPFRPTRLGQQSTSSASLDSLDMALSNGISYGNATFSVEQGMKQGQQGGTDNLTNSGRRWQSSEELEVQDSNQ